MAIHKELTLQDVIDQVNSHTSKEFNELAAMTAKQFRIVEKRLDTVEGSLSRFESHFEDIKDHLVLIDNRIGTRPQFEFKGA